MGFAKSAGRNGFRTEVRRSTYDSGYGLIIDLEDRIPREYDSDLYGDMGEKGLVLRGFVVAVLGAGDSVAVPVVGDCVNVVLRKGDVRKVIFDDLEKTREDVRFLLEGVTGELDALEARWAHGAGRNRSVEAVEIVGPPHLSFENPEPSDGPKNGWLHLNLDGLDTEFDVRGQDGFYTRQSLPFSMVIERLKVALEKNLKLRVGQRVLKPSLSKLVNDQEALEKALADFRSLGFTACVVRSFVGGTTNAKEVDVQFLMWPLNMPANGQFEAKTYEVPMLQETARFVALRDGEEQAFMEVIPGYIANLIGNKETEKSTKHKFASSIVRSGISDGQKNMYGAQGYGPGIILSAVQENGDVTGLTRLAIRTQGPQYPSVMNIPSQNFLDADKVRVVKGEKEPVSS